MPGGGGVGGQVMLAHSRVLEAKWAQGDGCRERRALHGEPGWGEEGVHTRWGPA